MGVGVTLKGGIASGTADVAGAGLFRVEVLIPDFPCL